MTRKTRIFLGCFLLLLIYLGSFVISYDRIWKKNDPLFVTDIGRIEYAQVRSVETPQEIISLQNALAYAQEKNLKVSIAGSKHSQGGHTFSDDGVILDMTSFNKILKLDRENRILTVQSGAKWKDVQEYINPYGLAVKVMQSSNIFTVGGSLSANAHGRDLDRTSIVETVRSFRLLTADGSILNVSRTEHPELFSAVIGGYGLFGVILDVDIELTEDETYRQKSVLIDLENFPDFFQKNIQADDRIKMFLGRPSIDPNDFLREMIVTTWSTTDKTSEQLHRLTEEENVIRDKFFFGLSRKFDWAKSLRWKLQKKIEFDLQKERTVSRNNAMRPPLAPVEFLEYYSETDTDILQEYYVPVQNFVPFMDEFRKILQKDEINVLSCTVRYVKANKETDLPYAPKEDSFAIIYLANVRLSEKDQDHVERMTQQIVDAALKYNGTYYLTYQLYPTKKQFKATYPQSDIFFEKKKKYDPQEMFVNKFYEKYGK